MKTLSKLLRSAWTVIMLVCLSYFNSNGQLCSADFIVNGSFENGNNGFTSGLNPTGTTLPGGGGDYAINTNANLAAGGLNNIPAQSGNNFMIVDGSSVNPTIVWQQTTPACLIPGQQYTFSFFAADVHTGYPPNQSPSLTVDILNQSLTNPVITTGLLLNNWSNQYTYTFTATTATATIVINQANFALAGNDFGIDNIQLNGAYILGLLVTSTPCTGGTCNGTATGTANTCVGGNLTYSWNTNPVSNAQTITQCAGTFTVTVTDANGCSASENVTISPACPSCSTVFNADPIVTPIANQSCWWSTGGNSSLTVNGNNNFLGTTFNSPLRLYTNNAERLRVNPAGLVGINTTTPTEFLDVDGDGRFRVLPTPPYNDNTLNKIVTVDNTGKLFYRDANTLSGIINNCHSTFFVPRVMNANGDLTCSQIYDNTVNVGINTTSPLQMLDVNGNVNIPFLLPGTQTLAGYFMNNKRILNVSGSAASNVNVGVGAGANLSPYGEQLNTNVGYLAGGGLNVKSYNTCIGGLAGQFFGGVNPNDANFNTFVGVASGNGVAGNSIGGSNSCLGAYSGYSLTAGSVNVFVGNSAGYSTDRGINNVFVGTQAGWANTSANNNTYVGEFAGYANTGPNNTFIGQGAGSFPYTVTNASALGQGAAVCQSNSMRFGNAGVNTWSFGTCVNPGDAMTVNNGAHLTTGGVWTDASDRNLKENIVIADGKEMLSKLHELEISTWNYKSESSAISHIGPMAQDFYSIFKFGNDDKSISAMDKSGIALVCIKELDATVRDQQQKIDSKDTEIENLKDEIQTMKSRLNEFESALSRCCTNFENKTISSGINADRARLEQNVPNPFDQKTTIKYYMPNTSANAAIYIYTLDGVRIGSYNLSQKGVGEIEINGSTMAPGTYIYYLVVDGKQVESKLMTLTK